MRIAMPEKAMAEIIKTMSEEAPIKIGLHEYSNYVLKSYRTIIKDELY